MSTKFKGQEEFYCPNCELGPWGFWEIATGMCPICMEKMIKEDETLKRFAYMCSTQERNFN